MGCWFLKLGSILKSIFHISLYTSCLKHNLTVYLAAVIMGMSMTTKKLKITF